MKRLLNTPTLPVKPNVVNILPEMCARAATILGAVVLAFIVVRCVPSRAPQGTTTALLIADAQTARIAVPRASEAFERWLRATAPSRPDTFMVYVAGATPGAKTCVYRATAPTTRLSWRARAAHAAFTRDARMAFHAAAVAGFTAPQTAPVTLDAQTTVAVLPSACVRIAADFTPAAQPVNHVIFCSNAAIPARHGCAEDALYAAYDAWVAAGATRAGSSFHIVDSGRAASTPIRFTIETPNTSQLDRIAHLLSGRSALATPLRSVARRDAIVPTTPARDGRPWSEGV